MKIRFSDHPYLITSALFVGVFLFGAFGLDWGREDHAFVLLLFLIVNLGIRLDEISRAIGAGRQSSSIAGSQPERSLMTSTRQIETEISRIQERLESLTAQLNRKGEE
ncbi:MAG: hypothetical protein ACOWWM_00355 [Desulfobacterales bacterium]